jgi:hypothetical protein
MPDLTWYEWVGVGVIALWASAYIGYAWYALSKHWEDEWL